MAHSEEEAVSRDFICFGDCDVTAVVCDATCLERNLNLVLQILETGKRTMVCVNLMDEAAKNRIRVDLEGLEAALGVPVSGTNARRRANAGPFSPEAGCGGKRKRAPPIPFFYPPMIPPLRPPFPLCSPLRNGSPPGSLPGGWPCGCWNRMKGF